MADENKNIGKVEMELWQNRELIMANKINKYNQNIDNLWIVVEDLRSHIGEEISLDAIQIVYDSGITAVGGTTVNDFLDYVKIQLSSLSNADSDLNNQIELVQNDLDEFKNKTITSEEIEYKKYTYVNVKDFLDYLDNQIISTNANVKTNKDNIATTNTNIEDVRNSVASVNVQLKGVQTSLKNMQEKVDTLEGVDNLTASDIKYVNENHADILTVDEFLNYLEEQVKSNTANISLNKAGITANKTNIDAIKETLENISASDIAYNVTYATVEDFLDYVNDTLTSLNTDNTKNKEDITLIRTAINELKAKEYTAEDIKYINGDYTNVKEFLDHIETDKVNKEEGKSLIADTEIERLANVDNYDDTELRGLIDAKSDFSGSYDDLTDKPTIPSIEGLASETYVDNAVSNLVGTAPETLDTLNELAQALGDDPNFATTIATQLGEKADKTELHTHDNKDILDTITQEKIDGWESGVNIDLSEYAKLTDIANKFDSAQLNEAETNDTQIAIDFFSDGNKITTVYLPASTGGGGGATSSYISTVLDEDIMVKTGEDFNLILDFSSPNLGKGTLKVFINDVDSMSKSLPQGESTTVIPHNLFTKGTNKMVIYVLDRTGTMSNSLTFYVRYGSTELSSTFDAYSSYDYGSVIRYYFTPTALDTSLTLTFYMKIDGVLQDGIACTSDVRGYFTFPSNLSVGRHHCEAWVEFDGGISNILTFNLIIIDDTSLVVASDTSSVTIEEAEQLSLDYKVYMKNNTSFIVKTYIDEELINTGTCGLEMSYYKTSSLTEGIHTIKLEVWDVTETVSDYVTWTITVTPSTYEMKTPITAGAMFIASAKNKSNSNENKETWIGTNQDGTEIQATLTNFAFNSESGWMNDSLIISGNSWVEIPIAPLSNNAKYGFTLDIEFSTKPIGVENAEVLNLWDDENNCGIKITTEELIIQSKDGNRADLYFAEEEIVSAIFVIDRDEKMAKIYLNGVMCEAFALSDYEANGVKYLEDFTVNNNVFLGGYNKNGWSAIRNIRIYEVSLATDEIINNFISNKIIKSEQRELVEFQKGNNLPTVTVYCDFSGLGKDDKKYCDIVYNSPDVNKYGESWSLLGKTSQLQYQGTSSMAYPIKNYRLNPRDSKGKKKIKMFKDGQPESRFTLKADYMSSGHWQNTGLARFINDNLYNYNTSDEKSMNPMKWYSINNGGDLSDTRETINGFPCRLILVNDGETPLTEGQAEPTPGNTKDMGVFNFNNDKSNDKTFGFDTDIFPRCISYEVASNSDTSAGAFIPYTKEFSVETSSSETWKLSGMILLSDFGFKNGDVITYTYIGETQGEVRLYTIDNTLVNTDNYFTNGHTYTFTVGENGIGKINFAFGRNGMYNINGTLLYPNPTGQNGVTLTQINTTAELEYLQDSFELRFPDADDVGADYGYLGMEGEVNYLYYDYNYGAPWTHRIKASYYDTKTFTISIVGLPSPSFAFDEYDENGTQLKSTTIQQGDSITLQENTYSFQIYIASSTFDYILINGVKYFVEQLSYRNEVREPFTKTEFSTDYGLKRVIDWVGNANQEEFVTNFEKYFNKQYTLRYYLIVILLAMVDKRNVHLKSTLINGESPEMDNAQEENLLTI